jgi:hypothetical protein
MRVNTVFEHSLFECYSEKRRQPKLCRLGGYTSGLHTYFVFGGKLPLLGCGTEHSSYVNQFELFPF